MADRQVVLHVAVDDRDRPPKGGARDVTARRWRHRTKRRAWLRRGRPLLRLVVVGGDHERAVLVRQLARWCWPGGRCCRLVGLVVDADGAGFTSGAGLLLRIRRVGLALAALVLELDGPTARFVVGRR